MGNLNSALAGYRHGESLSIRVADTTHPITQGLTNWPPIDETYDMADADAENHLLLTVGHERNMRTVAWTRNYEKSSVFCLQLGHDAQAWENERFRSVLKQGIEWSHRNI